MIRFFSKLRGRLLAGGKLIQYGSYAAGEIALVVLGILIALQINTWNENQKAKSVFEFNIKEIYESNQADAAAQCQRIAKLQMVEISR